MLSLFVCRHFAFDFLSFRFAFFLSVQVSFPFNQTSGSGGGITPLSTASQPLYGIASLPVENTNINFCAYNNNNMNHNASSQEYFSSSSLTATDQMQYSTLYPRMVFMLPPGCAPNSPPGSVSRPVMPPGAGDIVPTLASSVVFLPSGNGGVVFGVGPNGAGGAPPAMASGGSEASDFSPPFPRVFIDSPPSRSYSSNAPFSVGVPPTSGSLSGISVNHAMNNITATVNNNNKNNNHNNTTNNAMGPFGVNANGFPTASWNAPALSGSTGPLSFSLGPNSNSTSSNGVPNHTNSGATAYLKTAGGMISEPSPQAFDAPMPSHSSSSFSPEKFLLPQHRRPSGSLPIVAPPSPLPPSSPGGGRKGNVYTALQQKGLRYIPYYSASPRAPSPNERERCAFLETLPEIPVFFQMFPCERRDRKETVNTILREVDPKTPIMGIAENVMSRSETSFIAYIRSDVIWHVIQRTRCRILMDRLGCWYADTLDAYLELKAFCEGIRRMPQQNRHTVTDGLPCMPLVVELSTLVERERIVAPPAEKCFDEEYPIQAVERHRNKK